MKREQLAKKQNSNNTHSDMHVLTRIFSLIGRPIVLNTPCRGCSNAKIIKKVGPAWFIVQLDKADDMGNPITFNCPRSNFHLPPLDKWDRQPKQLSDASEGFAYAGVEDF